MSKPLDLLSNPVRVGSVRKQIAEMERIRDFVVTLPMHDREEWVAALEPLTDRLLHELACHEGTGSLGSLLLAGFAADGEQWDFSS